MLNKQTTNTMSFTVSFNFIKTKPMKKIRIYFVHLICVLSPGGSNTAGLGGFGGPYRLDAGHNVAQVPQWQKDNVPEHVRQAAREMAQKAFKERYMYFF